MRDGESERVGKMVRARVRARVQERWCGCGDGEGAEETV